MKRFLPGLALLILALAATQAASQTYPNKPVRVIVPFAAGAASDTIARNLNGSLGAEYERAIGRYYGPRQKIALGFLRFIGTPAFSWVTEMLAFQPVEKALTWALAHV